jgi:aminoglycoside 6-adenylyltransferase
MKDFEDRIVAWARSEDYIRAVVVTGSQSRTDNSRDEWSDLDVQLYTTSLAHYAADQSWANAIGQVWICFDANREPANPSRLVWFAGGKKVDFTFKPLTDLLPHPTIDNLSDEHQRGYYVVLDKDGLFTNYPASPHRFPPAPAPTAAEYQYAVDEFWFEAIHVAQFIRRRELWVAKFRDWTMKTCLLQMIEWHAQAGHDWNYNTWIIGKRIDRWTDAATWKAIHGIWSGYDPYASWQALLSMLDLFTRLSADVAAKLTHPYNSDLYTDIHVYIRSLYTADPLPPQ